MTEFFSIRNGELCCEDAPLAALARKYGTPLYVYSRAAIESRWRAYDSAFGGYPHQVCYAVKANANLAVLGVLARLGSGFDIVSGGELKRVLKAGGDPARVVYSGVGKSDDDIRLALESRIQCLNVESAAELARVNDIAGSVGYPAPVALRINPDVDAGTHPYIATGLAEAKFGIPIGEAQAVYREAARMPHLEITGVAAHIGSQIDRLEPFVEALRRVLDFTEKMARGGMALAHLDLGGGLGIAYREERVPRPEEHVAALVAELEGRGLRLPVMVEPGRSIVGQAGVLLTRVEYLKTNGARRFAVVDAGMNDLIRPALYEAWHRIVPVTGGGETPDAPALDVVGPVCESGDVLGRDRRLAVRAGDLLAVMSAGAYGFAMSSNYNARPRPAEVLVSGRRHHLARRRETFADLVRGEKLLPP